MNKSLSTVMKHYLSAMINTSLYRQLSFFNKYQIMSNMSWMIQLRFCLKHNLKTNLKDMKLTCNCRAWSTKEELKYSLLLTSIRPTADAQGWVWGWFVPAESQHLEHWPVIKIFSTPNFLVIIKLFLLFKFKNLIKFKYKKRI